MYYTYVTVLCSIHMSLCCTVQSAPATVGGVPKIPKQLDRSVVSGKTSSSMINAVARGVPTDSS
jgi:hypothetical protein